METPQPLIEPKVEPHFDSDGDFWKYNFEIDIETVKQEIQEIDEALKEENCIISKFEIEPEHTSEEQESTDENLDLDWDCAVCLNKLPVEVSLKEHLHSHFDYPESKNRNECPICGLVFTRLSKVLSHIITTHKNDNEDFEESDWDEYSDDDDSDSDYLKDEEDLELEEDYEEVELGRNRRKSSSKSALKLSKCPICQKWVKCLSGHRIYHDPPKFECSECGKKLFTKANLEDHRVRIHTTEKCFHCFLCGKSFAVVQYLRCHLKRHREKKQAQLRRLRVKLARRKCMKCGRRVVNWEEHQRQHDGELDNGFPCKECPKIFDKQSELRRHVMLYHHSDKNRYRCPVCPKVLTTIYTVKKHIEAFHSNKRPYECQLCHRTYKRLRALRYHERHMHGRRKRRTEAKDVEEN